MRGYIESLAEHEAWGWAYDDADPASHLQVVAHLDGVQVGAGPADIPRADLAAAGIGAGDHMFRIPFTPRILPAALPRLSITATSITALGGPASLRLEPLPNSLYSRADQASDPGVPVIDAESRPVFILGPARSGTSALALALLAAGFEGHGEGHLMPLAHRLLTAVDGYYAGHDALGGPDTRLRSTHISAFQRMVRRGFIQLSRAAYPSGRWIDKTPTAEMVRAAPLMQEIWPQARFIFLKRRVIENLASRRRKFPDGTLESHYLDWVDVLTTWAGVRDRLGPAAIEVEQLELARRPADTAAAIAAFLGLAPADAGRFQAALIGSNPEQTAAALGGIEKLDRLALSPGEEQQLRRACAPAMAAYGYSFDAGYYVPGAPGPG